MADMEIDPLPSPTTKRDGKDDAKESKKRFEVKKVGFTCSPLNMKEGMNCFCSGTPSLFGPGVCVLIGS